MILELMHFLSFLHKKLFWFCHLTDFKIRSWKPHSADMFGCAWVEYLWNIFFSQSSLFTYFTLKWNSIINHADGNSNPPHNDFSSFAEHPHPWSMTNISLFIFLLAPSGALIAIPTYYWSSTPLFQITPVLNTGLSLSEPLKLYKGYNAI